MDKHLTLLRVMTPFPQCVDPSATLAEAAAVMEAHEIHHLPVKEEHGELLGMLTAADVDTARRLDPARAAALTAADLCRTGVFVVDQHAALPALLREMALRHASCALVRRDEHLVGIVTTTDLCLALAELLDPDIDDIIA